MCNWGEWSALYEKCKLYDIPVVNTMSGSAEITTWCNNAIDYNQLSYGRYHQDPMLCLANNYEMCQWGNLDSKGLAVGGWSGVYSKCKLYDIPVVNTLSGSEEITNWCDAQ